MITRPILYLTTCVVALYGFPTAAATVIPYAGDVFVSQGHGFQKIGGTTAVKVGDSVMVSPNGLAQVQLDDGNAITVSPGQVLSVPAKARAKDAALPNGANATRTTETDVIVTTTPTNPTAVVVPPGSSCDPPSRIDGCIGAAALLAGAAAVAAALATSRGPSAPVIVPAIVAASP